MCLDMAGQYETDFTIYFVGGAGGANSVYRMPVTTPYTATVSTAWRGLCRVFFALSHPRLACSTGHRYWHVSKRLPRRVPHSAHHAVAHAHANTHAQRVCDAYSDADEDADEIC